MRRVTGLLLAVLAVCILQIGAAQASASKVGALKIATWNLDWLTAKPAGDPVLPRDVRPKSAHDIALLHGYANILNADVVAFEEVDGPGVAARVFSPRRYVLHLTRDHVVQRVGLAIRRGIAFTANPDVTALDTDPHARYPLRSGADVTLHLPGGALRILAVHLKTGCWQPGTHSHYWHACRTLAKQDRALARWIRARRREGVPFVVLGDFNRRIDRADPFLRKLERAAPLVSATAGQESPCWGGERFIDQILLGGAARHWVEPDSLRVLVYRQTGHIWKRRLSDHCPVSVRLHLPG